MNTDNHNIRLVLIIDGEDFYLCQDVTQDDDILEIIDRISKNFIISSVILQLHIGSSIYDINIHTSVKPT